MDAIEETELVPGKKIFYQFSARGHDLAQVLLGLHLTHPKDAICGYYRSRPILLSLGVALEDALGSAMGRAGGYSDGRDIGVVFNYPNPNGASALPMCGGVGAQFTPTAGYAQAIEYQKNVLGDRAYDGAIGVVLGGDASVATNGFWSALTIATTQNLCRCSSTSKTMATAFPYLAPSRRRANNIAKNLASFSGLHVLDGDGADPALASELIAEAVAHVRAAKGPCLLHLNVPRLEGHSFQDTQAYKSKATIEAEWAADPLPKLKAHVVPSLLSEKEWGALEAAAKERVKRAAAIADQRPVADPEQVTRHVFDEGELQTEGGQHNAGYMAPRVSQESKAEGARINMITAIRRTLDHELAVNPRVLVFGEDVGPKGGVHGVTLGLQEKYGPERVFDTSLSEEGIIGRAVGMAIAGLMPVPEIQFRKYAEPACEQISDCGSMRWRTANRFAAPMVVRMPIGFFKCGDPWHSADQ